MKIRIRRDDFDIEFTMENKWYRSLDSIEMLNLYNFIKGTIKKLKEEEKDD